MKNKRGMEMLYMIIIFVILNVLFFTALFIYVARAGTGVNIKEKIYAKQIALLIDQKKQGTTLTINISEMQEIADKNKFKGRVVEFDYEENKVTVSLTSGKGYTHSYFTELNYLHEENKLITIS